MESTSIHTGIHRHIHTLDTDETVHLVRMIQANNSSTSTRKRAISCKWTQKEKETELIKSIAHFTTHKCASASTNTSTPIASNPKLNPQSSRVYCCWSHTKSLFFLHTQNYSHQLNFECSMVIFGICDTIKSMWCFYLLTVFAPPLHTNITRYTNQFGDGKTQRKTV